MGVELVLDLVVIYFVKDGKYYFLVEDVVNGVVVSDNLSILFEVGKKYKIRVINMFVLVSEFFFLFLMVYC